jgi:hypothetical protein
MISVANTSDRDELFVTAAPIVLGEGPPRHPISRTESWTRSGQVRAPGVKTRSNRDWESTADASTPVPPLTERASGELRPVRSAPAIVDKRQRHAEHRSVL